MKCMRCLEGEGTVVAKAPDGSGAWEIYQCTRCNFGWRTTEPEEVLDVEKRDPRFQLVGVDLEKLLVPCPIPPLRK